MMRSANIPGKSIHSMDDLRKSRDGLHGHLLLYDLDSEGFTPEEVLPFASQSEARVVGLMSQFDSKEWITLFRAGAADILRYPVTVEQIEQAVRGPLGLTQTGRQAGWIARAMLAGKRLLHL